MPFTNYNSKLLVNIVENVSVHAPRQRNAFSLHFDDDGIEIPNVFDNKFYTFSCRFRDGRTPQ